MTGFAWEILGSVFEIMGGVGTAGMAVTGLHDLIQKSRKEKTQQCTSTTPASAESKEETTSENKNEPATTENN